MRSKLLMAALAGLLSLSSVAAANDLSERKKPKPPKGPRVETVTNKLQYPWGMAFLPDGSMLVTEKPGRLRRVTMNGRVSPPISGVPTVAYASQGGLLDVALDPNFSTNRHVYLTYSRPATIGTSTALARATLSADMRALTNVTVLFIQAPTFSGPGHYGSRIAFDGSGHIFVSLGDRQQYPPTPAAQDKSNHLGKVVRLNMDGSVPSDNPFVLENGALPANWSYGHRNPQGLAFHPTTGSLFVLEHGPLGGDELNIVLKGENYGWPVVSHGVNYDGSPVGSGQTSAPNMVDPVRTWTPVIAPGGFAFYNGNAFPAWRGDMFIAGLGSRALVRLDMNGDQVVSEQRLLTDRNKRFRAVAVGPDGFLYVATDDSKGEILRIRPR